MTSFVLNGSEVRSEADGATPLLWVLRDEFGLKGTKYGCGIARCGACTVHVNGSAQRSCVLPVTTVAGSTVTTIEGIGEHPLKTAWVEAQVPQCGYCQSGQIMQAASLLSANPAPDDGEIVRAMNGNLCRCMAYRRIRAAIRLAAGASS